MDSVLWDGEGSVLGGPEGCGGAVGAQGERLGSWGSVTPLALREGSSRKMHTSGTGAFKEFVLKSGVNSRRELRALTLNLLLLTSPGTAGSDWELFPLPGAPQPCCGQRLSGSGVTTPTPCSCSVLPVWFLLPLSLSLSPHPTVLPVEVPPLSLPRSPSGQRSSLLV